MNTQKKYQILETTDVQTHVIADNLTLKEAEHIFNSQLKEDGPREQSNLEIFDKEEEEAVKEQVLYDESVYDRTNHKGDIAIEYWVERRWSAKRKDLKCTYYFLGEEKGFFWFSEIDSWYYGSKSYN